MVIVAVSRLLNSTYIDVVGLADGPQDSSFSIRLHSSLAELEDADDDGHQSQDRGDDAEDDCAGRVGVLFGVGGGRGEVCGRVHG